MKKKAFAVLGALAICAFTFSGFKTKVTSLEQLSAKGIEGCAPQNGVNCLTPQQVLLFNYEYFKI